MSELDYSSLKEEAFLTNLRKQLASYVAQKLTFSLFQAGQYNELKWRIRELVDEKLQEEGIPLDNQTKEMLIDQLMSGMPIAPPEIAPPPKPAPPVEMLTLDQLQTLIKPYLASMLSDDLFKPERKTDLSREIVRLVDRKIAEDEIPVSVQQRVELIETICSTMGLQSPLRSVEDAAVAEEENFESLATALIPSLADRTADVSVSSAAPAKRVPGVRMLPIKALTHEIKRDLLYFLSGQLNAEILASGDELNVRSHIFDLIHAYCTEKRFTLNDEDVEEIVQEILGGNELEFQL